MSCSCPEKKKFNNSESVQSISICGFDSSLKKAQLSTLFLINKNKTIPCQETTQNKQSNLKKKTLRFHTTASTTTLTEHHKLALTRERRWCAKLSSR